MKTINEESVLLDEKYGGVRVVLISDGDKDPTVEELKESLYIHKARMEFLERLISFKVEALNILREENENLTAQLINLKTKQWWRFWR